MNYIQAGIKSLIVGVILYAIYIIVATVIAGTILFAIEIIFVLIWIVVTLRLFGIIS